jgi:hypothetical protein
MSSHNKFLSFLNNSSSEVSSSTFIVENGSNILSIEVTESTAEIIVLPDAETSKYDQIQYRKLVDTTRDITFFYNGLQKGKMYHHRQQYITFHKFNSLDGSGLSWIT